MVETTRSFLMSDRSLHLEASLDKEVYKQTCKHAHSCTQLPLLDICKHILHMDAYLHAV